MGFTERVSSRVLVPARRSRAGASDSDGGGVDGVSYDINEFIIYPSRKSYFQAEELPKDYDLGEAPKNSPKGLRQSREYKRATAQASSYSTTTKVFEYEYLASYTILPLL